LNMC